MKTTYQDFIQNILNTRGRFDCGNEYHERHHIVPKCMGGTNEEENLIDLFAREHFIAHKLLAQENPDNEKLTFAWSCMAFKKNNRQQRYELTPEEYEEARIAFSNVNRGKHLREETKIKISESLTGRSSTELQRNASRVNGKKNRGRKHTEEEKKKIGIGNNGKILSKETREKLSNAKKGKRTTSRLTPVAQYDSNTGELIRKWESIIDASLGTNTNSTCISACIHGKRKSAGGFIWKFI